MRPYLMWLAILGGVTPAVVSQSPTAAQQQRPTVEESVVVTAALGAESIDQLPVSAEVIDREEIAARQVIDVADLLRTVPGLDVVRSGTAGKVTSLFTRGTESDHTLVLWNGLELNNPYFGGFDWGLLPTDGVERVEIVRGPFSSLYGSDAVGGVVQVLSGSSSDTLSIEVGENGYQRAALVAGVEHQRFRLDLVASRRHSDGEVDNDFYDGEDALVRARWQVGDGIELGVTARANESELGIPFSGGAPTPNRRTRWSESEVALPISIDRERWSVDGQLSRVELESRFADPDDPFGFTASQDRSTSERGRMVATRHAGEDLWWAVGSDYETQQVDAGSVFGTDLDGERQTTRALFGQLFRAVGRWRFDLGLRADDHDAFGSATTPRAGIGYAAGDRQRWHFAFAEGFRAPSIGELFFPFSGNPALEAEKSESLELGWRYVGATVEVSATAFRTDLDELIDFDFITFSNVNIGRARTRGVEGGVALHGRARTLRANVTWLDTENLDSGLELLRRPEWRASAVGTWRPADWVLSATALHVGDRADVDPITFGRSVNPAWQRLDLAARYRGWSRWSPYARVENLTDESYAEALGFPAPGRTVFGGVSLEF